MKIAIISTFLGQKLQGGEISSFLLAETISQKEKVFAVTAKITERLPFKTYSFPFLKLFPNQFLIIGHKSIDRYLTRTMLQIFKKEKPDLIHLQDFFMMIAALKAAKKLKIPTLLTVRSTTFACNLSIGLRGNNIPLHYSRKQYRRWLFASLQEAKGCGWLSYWLEPWFYQQNQRMRHWFSKVDHFISVSDFVKEQLIRAGINKNKIQTIKVQKPEWEVQDLSAPFEIRIFTAGALTKFKGFDYLIRAFKKVAFKYPQATLRIAGEGSEEKKLKDLSARLGLKGRVWFLGRISQKQMQEEYAKSIVVICPSVGPESLSRIIYEAFSMRKAVIATKVGGNPEMVIHNKTGILVSPYQEAEMAGAMLTLIRNKPLREKLAQAGYLLVQKEANHETIVKEHLEVYKALLKK